MLVGIITPSTRCLAILVSVTFVQCTEYLIEQEALKAFGTSDSAGKNIVRSERATNDYEYLPFGGTPTELLSTSNGFLAGEDTPVWLAYNPNTWPASWQSVSYTKLGRGRVKKAIDYWKSIQTTSQGRQSAAGYANFAYSERSTNSKVLYPTVLAVLDYDKNWPQNEAKQEVWINEGILYALAFWNGVNLQLRYIKNPAVQIRLAGIVLGRTRGTTPYIPNNTDWCLKSEDISASMMAYWKRVARDNPDFDTSAYDTIATMTSSSRCDSYVQSILDDPGDAYIRAHPFVRHRWINGIVVYDDANFRGIQAAVHLMARRLGAKIDGPCRLLRNDIMEISNEIHTRGYGRKWSVCTLEEINTNLLAHGTFLRSPKEYHRPGNPVEIILPGKLVSVKEQCKKYLEQEPQDCFQHMRNSPCGELLCAVNSWGLTPCNGIGRLVVDGSTCDVGFSGNGQKICLDGRCVKDPWTLA